AGGAASPRAARSSGSWARASIWPARTAAARRSARVATATVPAAWRKGSSFARLVLRPRLRHREPEAREVGVLPGRADEDLARRDPRIELHPEVHREAGLRDLDGELQRALPRDRDLRRRAHRLELDVLRDGARAGDAVHGREV